MAWTGRHRRTARAAAPPGGEGITVFVSSHLLSEIELVATHVGVLQAGRLRFQGHLRSCAAACARACALRAEPALRAAELLLRLASRCTSMAMAACCSNPATRDDGELNSLLVEHGLAVSLLQREQPSLESLFFDLTVDAALERAA
jgi:ABC-2 type transport system ATP-binding protein